MLGAVLFVACGGDAFTSAGSQGPSKNAPDGSSDAASGGSDTGGARGSGEHSGSGGRIGTGARSSAGGKGTGATGTGAAGGDASIPPVDGGGATGAGGDGAGGQSGSGGLGSGGTNDTGGAGTGSGGTSGTSNGGSGGTSCTAPKTWYLDSDQDGYGSLADPPVMACDPPSDKYTTTGGDCDDDEVDVHPQLSPREKKFFDIPYKTMAGAISYDYDCSGKEEGSPDLPIAGTCQLLMLGGACSGSGYHATTRTTMGANPYCGSQSFQTCKGSTLCSATTSTTTPYTCR